jgi:hypothetical protein
MHLEEMGLPQALECVVDTLPSEEFGPGACLYHGFVSIIAYEAGGGLAFGVLHPADDRDKCPRGEPAGVMVPWIFDVRKTANQIRRLARAANRLYDELGIGIGPLPNVYDMAKLEMQLAANQPSE